MNQDLQKALATVRSCAERDGYLRQVGLLFRGKNRELERAVQLIAESSHLIKEMGLVEKLEVERVVEVYNRWVEKGKKRLRKIPPLAFKWHIREGAFKLTENPDLFKMRKVSATKLPWDILKGLRISENVYATLPGEVFVFTKCSYLLKSQQSGFPHRSLLPGAWQEKDLPQNYWLMKKKGEIAEGLLPDGKYHVKARCIYFWMKELDFSEQERVVLDRLGGASKAVLVQVATFQLLFFYKLLSMQLDRDQFVQEIDKYFKTVLSLLPGAPDSVQLEDWQASDLLSELV